MSVIDLAHKQFKVDMAKAFIKSLVLLVISQCHNLGGMHCHFVIQMCHWIPMEQYTTWLQRFNPYTKQLVKCAKTNGPT